MLSNIALWLQTEANSLNAIKASNFSHYTMGSCERIASDGLNYIHQLSPENPSAQLAAIQIYFKATIALSKLYHDKDLSTKNANIQEVVDLCKKGFSKLELYLSK